MMLGNIYSLKGRYEDAERTLKTAIEYLSPRDREEPTWIYSDLAGVYAKQGQYDRALEMMKLASRGRMHNSAVEFNLGEIYRMMGDLEKAAEYFKKSLAIDRKNVKALEQLGLVLQQRQNWDESNRWYIALSKLTPNSATVHLNIGRNYMMLREFPRAIPALERSLALSPDNPRALEFLGNAYLSMTKTSKGMEYLEEAARLAPDDAGIRASYGNALFAAGQKTRSYDELHAALDIDPNNARALMGMGILASDQGRADIARVSFTRILQLEPENVKAMVSLGILAFNENKREEAIHWLKKRSNASRTIRPP
ncbi:MAG: tetratricopeptide repeat protein [Deltaproteobacteria bacterium]|nr:tetratricopeptide repeat protein [Deltaproteobacteria bacterium]